MNATADSAIVVALEVQLYYAEAQGIVGKVKHRGERVFKAIRIDTHVYLLHYVLNYHSVLITSYYENSLCYSVK